MSVRPLWIDSGTLPANGSPLQLKAGATGEMEAGTAGGASLSTPKVAYVETDGNNGTAVIGNPSLPFATAQAANDAIEVAVASDYGLHLGVGSHGGITGISAKIKSITGRGANLSFLGGITTVGGAVTLTSDMSCNLGDINTEGDTGYTGSDGGESNGGDGGPGQAAGTLSLRSCVFGTASLIGGIGGAGGTGTPNGNQGFGGDGGSFEILGCRFFQLNSSGGSGFLGGAVASAGIISHSLFESAYLEGSGSPAGKAYLSVYAFMTGFTETSTSVLDSTMTLP